MRQLVEISRPRTVRSAYVGDVHVPYHDAPSLRLVLEFLRWFRPHRLYLLGDWADCGQVSRYPQDPELVLHLQSDLDECASLLADVRAAVGRQCEITYLDGNHEHRLKWFLWQTPAMSRLRSIQLPELLQLPKLGMRHVGYQAGPIDEGGLLIEHGDISRRHSGTTARAMLDRRGRSGISGHTHRLSAYYKTDMSGEKVWLENGCLCRFNLPYLTGAPDWQRGFTVATHWGNRFEADQVRVSHGRIFYGGRLWQTRTHK